MMIIIDANINHQQALGMGQNTLGDHMLTTCTFRAFARATEHAIFSLHFLMHS